MFTNIAKQMGQHILLEYGWKFTKDLMKNQKSISEKCFPHIILVCEMKHLFFPFKMIINMLLCKSQIVWEFCS